VGSIRCSFEDFEREMTLVLLPATVRAWAGRDAAT
jgi:hypothetical protein